MGARSIETPEEATGICKLFRASRVGHRRASKRLKKQLGFVSAAASCHIETPEETGICKERPRSSRCGCNTSKRLKKQLEFVSLKQKEDQIRITVSKRLKKQLES